MLRDFIPSFSKKSFFSRKLGEDDGEESGEDDVDPIRTGEDTIDPFSTSVSD